MFVDSPPVSTLVKQVIVIEETDKPYNLLFVQGAIETAQQSGATYSDASGAELFYVVFSNEPRRLHVMTQAALRSSLRRKPEERIPKEQLLDMGEDARIMEILETFEYGSLSSFARKELPIVCRELEIETIGQLRRKTRSELAGPRSQYIGTKTNEWIDTVLKEFGFRPLRW